MPTLTPEQAKTFRKVTKAEHERFKKGRGRPSKPREEKSVSVTFRIDPMLLLRVKRAALKEGKPWQTFLKNLVEERLENKENSSV